MQKIIAAGGLVVNENGELLFIYRRKHWDLPKGKLDKNETIEECAIREVKEEVGIKNVKIVCFLYKTEHQYFDKWIQQEVIKETHWYLMKTKSTEKLYPQLEEDIEKIEWVNTQKMDKYLNNTYPTIIKVIDVYLEL